MAKKVVVELGGRLGNVLFKTAAGLYYHGCFSDDEIYYHYSSLYWAKYYQSYNRFHLFKCWDKGIEGLTRLTDGERFSYHQLPDCDSDVLLDGGFETELYFPDKNLIDSAFGCPESIKSEILKEFPDIEECVGISIRRGDYLMHKHLFYVPKITWFTDTYHKYFEGRKAIIFSDDIDWCIKNMEPNENFRFYKPAHAQDMYMIQDPCRNIYTMALCHDHICADSTWSWWGARLCEQSDSVNIFQDKRFKPSANLEESDYIPARWIKEPAEYE